MHNLNMNFTNALFLLLLIPAVLFTLYPYFRVSKKYRNTRNRITSMVLHALIMLFSISVLAGISFSYAIDNLENEVILLVDSSFSNQTTESQKDQFVKDVIKGTDDIYKLGIVTFGYNQVYAVPMTHDIDSIYDTYKDAEKVDTTATDISSALMYAKSLFKNPKSAKIVLMTDGLETDNTASTVITSIALEGIKIDTINFPNGEATPDVQVIGFEVPDYSIVIGNSVEFTITLQSNYKGVAEVTLYDNDEASMFNSPELDKTTVKYSFGKGIQTITVKHQFQLPGMHTLYIDVQDTKGDTLNKNNRYYSFVNLMTFDKILMVQRTGDESTGEGAMLYNLLTENDYDVTLKSVMAEGFPTTVNELREYDQVILVNIANSDMPEGFVDLLNSYVYEVGGGLLTVGGNVSASNSTANMYNENDLAGTQYQAMLPVQATDYYPPRGVMIIIDKSGSMTSEHGAAGKTKLEYAKEGAISVLNELQDRDYCGVMTLESEYSIDLSMTPVSQKNIIVETIDAIEGNGGTIYTGAIDIAGKALQALGDKVAQKHIIIVSDGEPADFPHSSGDVSGELNNGYVDIAEHYYKQSGVTTSIIVVGSTNNSRDMQDLADSSGGVYEQVQNITQLSTIMKDAIKVQEIKDVNVGEFQPQFVTSSSFISSGVDQADVPKLGGFYGTRLKSDATLYLAEEYAPIYAQWEYGAGRVGSFMCDLSGKWSQGFMSDDDGQRVIINMVTALFPTIYIRPNEIDVKFNQKNYTTQASIYTELEEEQSLELTVTNYATKEVTNSLTGNADTGYSRLNFAITEAGLYQIDISKKDVEGNILANLTTYVTFSYSKEYDQFMEVEDPELYLTEIADVGNGELIKKADQVFKNFETTIDKEYDPRIPLMILVILMLLADVAVRKFKFKWPHELIREFKEKRAEK